MVYLVLVVLGLCLGSFVNALVWRLHEQSKTKNAKKLKDLSIIHGRSMCSNCGHTLAWYDLLPVFSWLSLRGKCRYCGKPIPDSPLIELTLPILFIISYIYWPSSLRGQEVVVFVSWLAILTGLVALFIYDLKWMLLPNKILYPLFIPAAFMALLGITQANSPVHALLSTIYAVLVGGGIFYVLFQVSGGKWIGGGDVKLGGLLGLIVGTPALSLMVIFIASVLGTIFALPLIITKKLNNKSRIPFGPFLIIAGVIVTLFGASLLTWYERKFLLI